MDMRLTWYTSIHEAITYMQAGSHKPNAFMTILNKNICTVK